MAINTTGTRMGKMGDDRKEEEGKKKEEEKEKEEEEEAWHRRAFMATGNGERRMM